MEKIILVFILFVVIIKIMKHFHIRIRESKNNISFLRKRAKENNDELFEYIQKNWIQLSHQESIFHDPINNFKFIEPNGGGELVFNKKSGELITDYKIKGTYNFVAPLPKEDKANYPLKYFIKKIGHYGLDVFPYLIFGNGKNR